MLEVKLVVKLTNLTKFLLSVAISMKSVYLLKLCRKIKLNYNKKMFYFLICLTFINLP